MRTNRWLFLATLLLAACTADPTIESVGDTQTPVAIAQKLVNTSKDAQAGSLLVYLSDNAVAQIENNATRAANGRVVTRSGIVDVDNVLDKIGVTSLHRLFPLDTRNEAQTRAAGLHKWL